MFISRKIEVRLIKQFKISYPDMDKVYQKIYVEACGRMHQSVTELYESLHDKDGRMIFDVEQVLDALYEFKRGIAIDSDLIKDVALEINDTQQKHNGPEEKKGQ